MTENLLEMFKVKFPFAHDYFSALLEAKIQNRRELPQSIILEGADFMGSYYFALELARILNCKQDKSISCNCPSCKWVKSYSHPAINNVSQIHFKPENDESTTLISIKQAKEIEQSLTMTSDYHRFFIFFSSKKAQEQNNEYGYKPIDYTVESLNLKVFGSASANALLKSIEEPPKNTTFVFIAKSKDDILPTIVSRSQVFKLSAIPQNIDYSDIVPLMNNYFSLDYLSAINLSEQFLNYINENNCEIELVLNKMITYLKDILIKNSAQLYEKIARDISFIAQSIKHSRSKISDKIILEALFLKIARGY